ncbi:MAG: serpin family protein [bacterium]|nr:serpin family protein [bacterium]MBU1918716.1 serpin family protein [bacterium]
MNSQALTTGSLTTPFAVNVFQQVALQQGPYRNLTVATSGVQHAMAVLREASAGQTRTEIDRVMHSHMWMDADQDVFSTYIAAMRQGRLSGLQLKLASGLWVDKALPMRRSFQEQVRQSLGTQTRVVDFAQHAEVTTRGVNNWVTAHTGEQVQSLLYQANPELWALFVSVCCFTGQWQVPFDLGLTRRAFFTSGGAAQELSPIPMMYIQNHSMPFYEDVSRGAEIIEIDFDGQQASLVVVLPDDVNKLPTIEKKLSAHVLAEWFSGLEKSRAKGGRRFHQVGMPKYFNRSSFDLLPTMKALGVGDVFSEQANMEQLTGPVGNNVVGLNGDSLANFHFNTAYHDVIFGWDETGARTHVDLTMDRRLTDSLIQNQFVANHSFLFILRDRENNEILAMGRVAKPSRRDF